MNDLNTKAFAGLVFVLLIMATLLFLSAGNRDYWQAWVFLVVFGLSSLALTLYLMRKDPDLLARRVHAGPVAEKELNQKIIQTITSVLFIAMLVVPGFDRRYAWSPVPDSVALAGDVLVALGFLVIFFVYRENPFAAATIEVYPGQKAVSTGPYALVRHPMYLGGLVLLLGMSLSLGSLSGLVVFLLFLPALIWRIFDEERFLTRNLPGYTEYKNTVRYRLLPFIW